MKQQIFTGLEGRTVDDTIYRYREVDPTPDNAPNVVYILLDDMGFAHLGCYGSHIHTPNIDRLAAEGLRYNNFHTTAICSATRACLLTGANHHTAGVQSIIEMLSGCPNSNERLKPEYATIAEVLKEYGYATFCTGKWHLDAEQCASANPEAGWPLNKGFDRYYGTLHAEGDQYYPHLIRDNSRALQPKTAQEGYHFSEDIVDNAIRYVFEHHMNYPEQPFFLYLAFGALHTPHHAPKEYIDRYKGKFDEGWDVWRQRWYENQKRIGLIPEDAELTDRNPCVRAWADLNEKERTVYAREMEVFAGMLEHTDAQIGRLIDYLEESGQLDQTVIVFLSDNGASSEGGVDGRFNALAAHDILTKHDDIVDYMYAHLDEIGSEASFPHYATGWAHCGNTPFPWFKVWTHEGGVKDPLIIRYPAEIKDPGSVRGQYHHVSDLTPTILDILGIDKPSVIKGAPQKPCTGISLRYTFTDPDAPDEKHVQYYEMLGNRAIYKDGWKAVVNHTLSKSYTDDEWELYHVAKDYSEKYNVADQYPEKLRELQEDFMYEAGKYGVFPMTNREFLHTNSKNYTALTKADNIHEEVCREFEHVICPFDIIGARNINAYRCSHEVHAKIFRESDKVQGVIYSLGQRYGGLSFYIRDNLLKFAYNSNEPEIETVVSEIPVPVGESTISYLFFVNDEEASVVLQIDGQTVGSGKVKKLGYMAGFTTTVKANRYTAVTPDYEVPFEFAGRIDRLTLHQFASEADPDEELNRLRSIE